MNFSKFLNFSAISAGALTLLAALAACEGRTADNMTPDGDTVEVSIPSDGTRSDSTGTLAAPTDSIPEQDLL